MDAIIISDYDVKSLSGSGPLRLNLDGMTADIQVVLNYLKHGGRVVPPVEGQGTMTWSASMKLNGIFLYSYLTTKGYQVGLIDNFAAEREQFQQMLAMGPRAVIISTTFICAKTDLCKLVAGIREMAPDIFIIVGGMFVYLSDLIFKRSQEPLYNTEAVKSDSLFFNIGDPDIDLYIISLRGESILAEAMKRLGARQPLDDLPNTARKIGEQYVFTPRVDDITGTDPPAINWSVLPERVFASGVVPMQASTGCPYQCAFCNFTKDRRMISVKPLDDIVAELKAVEKRGARYVCFVDDNFRLGRSDLEEVCRRFVDEKISIQWMSFIRTETLKNVDLKLLREAGCSELRFGLESGDRKILENMRKKSDPDHARETIRRLLEAGINCTCYFIIGYPGETDETAKRTISYIQSLEYPEAEGLFSWSMYPFILAPMSPIFEPQEREAYALQGYSYDWKHKTMDTTRALQHLTEAFFTISNSSPVYRGDNLEYLSALTKNKRQAFVRERHALSKLALNKSLTSEHAFESFSRILSMGK